MHVSKLSTVQPAERTKTTYQIKQSREDDKALGSVDTRGTAVGRPYVRFHCKRDLRQIARVENACYVQVATGRVGRRMCVSQFFR